MGNGVGILLLLILTAVIGLIVGSIALDRTLNGQKELHIQAAPVLVHPTTANAGESLTPSARLFVGAMLENVSTGYGSTDTSGAVRGSVQITSQNFTVVVTFGKPYLIPPRSVMITAASNPLFTVPLAVSEVNNEGFQVFGTTARTSPGDVIDLFYYHVL